MTNLRKLSWVLCSAVLISAADSALASQAHAVSASSLSTVAAVPTVDWKILGGRVYNASSKKTIFYLRNYNGKADGTLRKGGYALKYTYGWHSQNYKTYTVTRGKYSSILHDVDAVWLEPKKTSTLVIKPWRGKSVTFKIHGGSKGMWVKVPQKVQRGKKATGVSLSIPD